MPEYQNRNQRGAPSRAQEWDFMKDFRKKWIEHNLDQEGVNFTENFGKHLKDKKFSTSQIRNVFGEIRRIQLKGFLENRTSFLLLRPKIAYAAKRNKDVGAKDFKVLMDTLIISVDIDKEGSNVRFQNFCDFFEAILAYHKASGGD